MTQLHAGGKFDQNFLQGVRRTARRRRLPSSTALSSKLQLRVWARRPKEHFIEFRPWRNAVAPLKVIGEANGKRGTEGDVSSHPPKTFTNVEYDFRDA